ncbi:MAG: hypothetical protein ACOC4G_07910 [Bacillota bacterium]
MSSPKFIPFLIKSKELSYVLEAIKNSRILSDQQGIKYGFKIIKENPIKKINTKTGTEITFLTCILSWKKRNIKRNEKIDYLENNDGLVFFATQNSVIVVLKSGRNSSFNYLESLLEDNFKDIVALPDELRVNHDFFKWLLYIRDMKDKNISSQMEIKRISDYEGSAADSGSQFHGQGETVIQMFPSKATIFSRQKIKNLKIMLKHHENICEFNYSFDGSLKMIFTNFIGSFFEHKSLEIRENLAIYYVYNHIIPDLKQAYLNDDSWNAKNKKQYEEKIGIELLKVICDKLNLAREDVVEILK